MRLKLANRVAEDLEEIGDYIAEDSPARAVTFVRELRAIEKIRKNPEIYRIRPELGKDARLAVYGRYVIFFRIGSDTKGRYVSIERVVHGSRDLDALATSED